MRYPRILVDVWQGWCLLYVLLFLLLIGSPSFAQVGPILTSDCVIAWAPNTETDLAGYKLYAGTTSGVYNAPTAIFAPTTDTLCSSAGIITSGQYYIALSAFDSSGNESLLSNEVPFYLELPLSLSVIVSVAMSGTGSGTVKSSPAGINCGAVCSYEFPPSTSVTLTAIVKGSSVFAGWIGEGCSGTGTCTVNKTTLATAVFNVKPKKR